jgi:hypothetical protein
MGVLTLCCVLLILAGASPARADREFRFNIHMDQSQGEVDLPRRIWVTLENNRLPREIYFFVTDRQTDGWIPLNSDGRLTEVRFVPRVTGQHFIRVRISAGRGRWHQQTMGFRATPPDSGFRMALQVSNQVVKVGRLEQIRVLCNRNLAGRDVRISVVHEESNRRRSLTYRGPLRSIPWAARQPGTYRIRISVASLGANRRHVRQVEVTAMSAEDYDKPRTGTVRMYGSGPDIPFPPFLPDRPPTYIPPDLYVVDARPREIDESQVWQRVTIRRNIRLKKEDRVTLMVRHEDDQTWTLLSRYWCWRHSRLHWTPDKPGKWQIRMDHKPANGREKRWQIPYEVTPEPRPAGW